MADTTFWPGDARLAITISMMFEANGQPISGAGGPITEPIKPGYPDLATNTYFDYGMREGIPRLLDLFDRRRIRVSSFMIGQAVEKNPQLAREIVERGHEVAAHGRTWEPQYALSREEERAFLLDSGQRQHAGTLARTGVCLPVLATWDIRSEKSSLRAIY